MIAKRLFALAVVIVGICAAAPSSVAQPILVGRVCCTNAGSCLLPAYGAIGAYCSCTGPWGTDSGRICQ